MQSRPRVDLFVSRKGAKQQSPYVWQIMQVERAMFLVY